MNLIESERLKYEKVYQYPGYGSKGHGAPIAGYLIERALGRGVLGDFGCGRGGSFQPYLSVGFTIQPIDHIGVLDAKWKEHSAVLPIVVANLWASPLPDVDYGICTDVMEHIPEPEVGGVLYNIACAVRSGCLWSICHVKDVWGDRIGERLHMTIRDSIWWAMKLSEFWPKVEIILAQPGTTIYWTEHGDLANGSQRLAKAAA